MQVDAKTGVFGIGDRVGGHYIVPEVLKDTLHLLIDAVRIDLDDELLNLEYRRIDAEHAQFMAETSRGRITSSFPSGGAATSTIVAFGVADAKDEDMGADAIFMLENDERLSRLIREYSYRWK